MKQNSVKNKMNSTSTPNFAVIIPLYNHRQKIRETVLTAQELGFPVWVVDDGSTDRCGDAVKGIHGVRILRHDINQGKGAALLTGMKAAAGTADWAVTLDADGQHHPQDAANLIKAIPEKERPVVVGWRQGMTGRDVPWTSQFGRRFSNFWVWCAGGPRIKDSQSGFRIYPLPETFDLNVSARRFQFEIEVLVKARWRGMPVYEAPVSVNYRPGIKRISHFRPFTDFMRNTAVFVRLIFQRVVFTKAMRIKRTYAKLHKR